MTDYQVLLEEALEARRETLRMFQDPTTSYFDQKAALVREEAAKARLRARLNEH